MITAATPYTAVFSEPPFGETPAIRLAVVAWDGNGLALVVDEIHGQLVAASRLRGFVRLEPGLPSDGDES